MTKPFSLFKQPEKQKIKSQDDIRNHEAEQLKIFLLSNHREANQEYNHDTDQTILKDCISNVEKYKQQLKTIDKKAAAAFTIGTAALIFSFIPFNWAITIAGFTIGGYLVGERRGVYEKYTKSLEDLKQCCNWTLNSRDYGLVKNNLELDTVKEILPTLAPLMNKKELENVLHDGIERNLLAQTGIDFDKQNHTFEYKMYGYQQGSFKDVMNGIGYAIQNAFNDMVDYCTPSTRHAHA